MITPPQQDPSTDTASPPSQEMYGEISPQSMSTVRRFVSLARNMYAAHTVATLVVVAVFVTAVLAGGVYAGISQLRGQDASVSDRELLDNSGDKLAELDSIGGSGAGGGESGDDSSDSDDDGSVAVDGSDVNSDGGSGSTNSGGSSSSGDSDTGSGGSSGSGSSGSGSSGSTGSSSATYYVSLSGSDSNTGLSVAQAFATFDQAASVVQPGDTVRFASGQYVRSSGTAALYIDSLNGTAAKPITITSVVGQEQQANFTVNNFNFYTGIIVNNSSHLVISQLQASESDAGIQVFSSNNITLTNNLVHNTGQLGIAARAPVTWSGSCSISGASSSYITITSNTIHTTGKKNNGFGEGVYVGQGCTTGDDTNNVTITYNNISGTGGEAVDIKQDTYNVTIEHNTISNIVVFSQGAITLGAAVHNYRDGNYIVRYNDIDGVTTSSVDGAAIWVGHGDTIVSNNTINDVSDYHGIFLASDFGNSLADDVTVTNNVLTNITGGDAIRSGEGLGGGSAGNYTISGNTF